MMHCEVSMRLWHGIGICNLFRCDCEVVLECNMYVNVNCDCRFDDLQPQSKDAHVWCIVPPGVPVRYSTVLYMKLPNMAVLFRFCTMTNC